MVADGTLVRELMKRPWLGNVRELRTFVARATAVGATRALSMESSSNEGSSPAIPVEKALPFGDVSFDGDFRTFRERWIARGESEYVRRLLAKYDRNVSVATREAGIGRTYLHRLIRKHDV